MHATSLLTLRNARFQQRVMSLGAALLFTANMALAQDDTPAPFQWFDALAFQTKPDLQQYGFKRLSLIGENAFTGSKLRGSDATDPVAIVNFARGHRAPTLACLDIKRWSLANDNIDASITKLARVADTLKTAWPNTALGFYALLPLRNYWAPVLNDPKKIAHWHAQNETLQALATHVDVVFPALYTLYDNQEAWAVYAKANLIEARRYGKPVYAFLSPQYHPSSPLSGQFIAPAFWRDQLALVRRYADGVVVAGGEGTAWDDDAAWWSETKKFIEQFAATTTDPA